MKFVARWRTPTIPLTGVLSLLCGLVTYIMIKNYLLSGFRALLRNKTFAILNTLGLAIGIAAGMLILQYVQHEFSYDKFHTKADRIYRVDHRFLKNGQLDFESARTFPRVGPAMHTEFPEIENYTRIVPEYRGGLVRNGDVAFHEDHIWYADSSLLTMFDFPWVKGDQRTALREINTAVIEERMAQKYFGSDDPIGKRMSVGSMGGVVDFEVRGVFRDPENSHLPMNIVLSYPTVISRWGEDAQNAWGWYDFHTYLLLKPGTDPLAVNAKLPAFVDRQGGQRMNSSRMELTLRPLTDIHLNSHLMMEAGNNGNSRTVYFLLILGMAILVIAWINYINLATARAMERAKEVGVRKVSGSSRWQLTLQFMMEAMMVNSMAVISGVAILAAFIPFFNDLTGKSFDIISLMNVDFVLKLAAVLVIGSLITGSYPALVLSSFKPISVLKGSASQMVGGNRFRQVMVIGQYVASVVLIAGTIVVYSQLSHLQSVELGINIDHTVVIKVPEVVNDRNAYQRSLESYRDELLSSRAVSDATVSSEIPGRAVGWYGGSKRVGIDQEIPSAILYMTTMDTHYFDVFDIDLVAGRNYDQASLVDSLNVIINTKAVAALGFANAEEAVAGKILLRGDTLNVIGVVEDYHHESPKDDYRPSAYLLTRSEAAYFSLKIDQADVARQGAQAEVVQYAQEKFARVFPGIPFDYFFLNDMYSQQYESENKFLTMFTAFATLAILIASLGLFGLSAYTISRRTKEVGIRKVLGSTGWQVFFLFAKDFLLLVIISNLVAIPIIWTVMDNWLSTFAQRITISFGVFVLTSVITVLLAVATISYHAWRSAGLNPAKALRTE